MGITRTHGFPITDGLNEEELAGAGVMVDTLRNLMKVSAQAKEEEAEDKDSPPKLISLDQVTVRGEDLTGKHNCIY